MNKSLKALLLGYILFKVNNKTFYTYNAGLAQRKNTSGNVEFNGLHFFKGWLCFYKRILYEQQTDRKPKEHN